MSGAGGLTDAGIDSVFHHIHWLFHISCLDDLSPQLLLVGIGGSRASSCTRLCAGDLVCVHCPIMQSQLVAPISSVESEDPNLPAMLERLYWVIIRDQAG